MNKLLEQINVDLLGKYPWLRLRRASLETKSNTLRLDFSYPEVLKSECKLEIGAAVQERLPAPYRAALNFVADKFDCEIMHRTVLEFVKKNYLSLYERFAEGLNVGKGAEGDVVFYRVSVDADKDFAEFFEKSGAIDGLRTFFSGYTVTPARVNLNVSEGEIDLSDELERVNARQAALSAQAVVNSRTIDVEITEIVIGGFIKQKPTYISDVKDEDDACTVCGRIKKIDFFQSKKENAKYKHICKATVADFTGSLETVFFCNEKLLEVYKTLCLDEEIVVFGSVKTTNLNTQSYTSLIARSISRCKITAQRKSNEKRKPQPSYFTVAPFSYEDAEQLTLEGEEYVPDACFAGTSFVAFDFETTGLSCYADKIIEIGAVKIIDGVMSECFHTLVNPECPIGLEASRISGITDDMVKDSPQLKQVVGDFYKFCYGSTLVAHNIGFDYSFIQYHAYPYDYTFDNNRVDTMTVARRFFEKRAGVKRPHNYKLQTIAACLDVRQKEAHRALDDARVCAEVFLKIVNSEPDLIVK